MQGVTERIREAAGKLLQDDSVDVVIGYKRGWDATVAIPCFLTSASQVDQLIFDAGCTHNLAKYLVGSEGYLTSRYRVQEKTPRVALVASPATMRTVAGLIQEHQIQREDLVVLGMTDGTPVGIAADVELGQVPEDRPKHEQTLALIQELESMTPAERRSWWDQELSKCVRCYACRQVCPFCYCEQCVADENQPQWVERSPSLANNRVWNTVRAFHLNGRCTGCGECERACPVGIPLMALNTKLSVDLEETFDYVAGMDADAPPALLSFQVEDPDDLS